MKLRTVSWLVGLTFVLVACGVIPRAAPFDPVIEDTVSEFDKAFQTFAVDLAGKAGTDAGEHGAYTAFYAKWHGELAHLRNRAIAADPADTCPLSGEVTEVLQVVVATVGATSAEALGASDNFFALAADAVERIDKRLNELAAELNQPEGTLTPTQVSFLQTEIAKLNANRQRLEAVSNGLAATEVAAPEGGCSAVVVAKLAEQFDNFERFHEAQADKGLPSRAVAPVILMNVTIQNVLKVQAVKKQKTEAGLL